MKELYTLQADIIEEECFIDRHKLPKEMDVDVVDIAEHQLGMSLKKYSSNDLIFYVKNKIVGDIILAISNYDIVSKKFADILLKHVQNKVELVPVTLICQRKKNLDYFLLNPLKLKSPIDFTKSQVVQLSTGRVIGIDKLVIRQDNLLDVDIYRFEEMRTNVVLSEQLKSLIDAANLKGVTFRPLSKSTF